MVRSWPQLDQAVAAALRLEVVAGLGERQPGVVGESRDRALREAVGRVDAGADRGAAEGQLEDPGEGGLEPLDPASHDGRVAAELLAERHRGGVHQVRAAGLHEVVELGGLGLQRRRELFQRRHQVAGRRHRRGDMDRGRERVVAGLAGVDLVVGVDVDPGLRGESGEHLVHVHVGRGAGAGLEDVDRERVDVLTLHDRGRGVTDRLCLLGCEDLELLVGGRGRSLDPGHRADQRRLDRGARDREVLDRPLGLRPPERVLRHADLAHAVVLDAVVLSHSGSPRRCERSEQLRGVIFMGPR